MPVKGETKPVPALVEGSRSLIPLPQRSATFYSLTALTPKGKTTHMVPLHLSGHPHSSTLGTAWQFLPHLTMEKKSQKHEGLLAFSWGRRRIF